MLDGDVAFTRGQRDVLQRHVALEVYPSATGRIGLRPSCGNPILASRRVRRGAFAATGRVALPQGLVERESAVGSAGDRDAFHLGRRHERGDGLVVAQLAAGLSVEMDRRRPAAREQQRVKRSCPTSDPNAFDPRSADYAFDLYAPRNLEPCPRRIGPDIENLDLSARLVECV